MSANSPSISQIYSAFDSDSHRVFRRAMSLSRGGVVRVNDLILAIVQLNLPPRHPELAAPAALVRELAGAGLPRSREEACQVAMSNEPALREILQRAWRIASGQPNRSAPQITSGCLAAAVMVNRGRDRRSVEETFQQLGLHLPSDSTHETAGQGTPAVSSTQSALQHPESVTADDSSRLIKDVLVRWMTLQSLDDAAERTRATSELAKLVKRIEESR